MASDVLSVAQRYTQAYVSRLRVVGLRLSRLSLPLASRLLGLLFSHQKQQPRLSQMLNGIWGHQRQHESEQKSQQAVPADRSLEYPSR